MEIRSERSADRRAIHDVVAAAFASQVEADLVDRLRADGAVIASLVAVDDRGSIVGHVLFHHVRVEGAQPGGLASLAPLSVRPDSQRRGIGSALATAGIDACARSGHAGILVVGDPPYYERFGFQRSTVAHLASPYAGDAFLGRELVADGIRRLHGRVVYPDAFAQL
jgi:putative acetyltransferase